MTDEQEIKALRAQIALIKETAEQLDESSTMVALATTHLLLAHIIYKHEISTDSDPRIHGISD